MDWIWLVMAGLLEIFWAYTMKLSDGFTRGGYTLLTLVVMAASFGLLSMAMKSLPLGTAYAIWTGIGTLGSFAVGLCVLHEAASPQRMLAVALIMAGLVLMKFASP